MENKPPVEKYLVLYIPWILSLLFRSDPEVSFMVAWLGSFLIFYISFSGWIKPLPQDLPVAEQLMRPIFLVQIIFAGYMCCTPIFYFLDTLGYVNFQKVSEYYLVDHEKLELIAQCQRYYSLGHAAFVTGILVFMNYPIRQKYYVEHDKIVNLLYWSAIITLPVSLIFALVPGLTQFSFQFSSLSFIAGTLALAFAIPQHKLWNTFVCAILYVFNFYQALISGFKEPIIISILVLAIFLYPTYKKAVLAIFIPVLVVLCMFLPTYNRIFREAAWSEDISSDEASQLALDAALGNDSSAGPQDNSNWGFLAYRLSEIDMFTAFVKSTPDKVDYYGFTLLKQSAIALIPRALWPSKPITEDLVMQRVYDAGVVYRGSSVSAKPAFIVDAYLSGGIGGIFIALFIYGAVAQLICNQAEKLFGGYILGTALIFSGLFQIMWRGLSFEFIINTVFWSYVSMIIIQKVFVGTHVLKEI